MRRWLLCWLCLPAWCQAENLLQLYDQMLVTHPVIKGQEYEIDQARAQEDIAFSRLLPQVSASGLASWNKMTQPLGRLGDMTNDYPGTRGMIQARQALFDLPSFLQWQGAGAQTLQAEYELDAVRMSLVADLVTAYFQVLEREDQLKFLASEQERSRHDLERVKRMTELKLTKVTDWYELDAYVESLLTDEVRVRGDRDIALEKLHELSGNFVKAVSPLNRQSLEVPQLDMQSLLNDALVKHPALRALSHGLDAADKQVDSARAGHLPQLSLQLSETYADNSGFDNRMNSRYEVGTLGVQVNVPIYSGGGTEAGVDKARAYYLISREKYNEKKREIERELRSAQVQLNTSYSRFSSANHKVKALEMVVLGQGKNYELGTITVVDFLEAKNNLLKAQFESSSARYDYLKAQSTLKVWSGNLARTDIEEINAWLLSDAMMPPQP